MPAKPRRPKTAGPPEAPEPASDEQILELFRQRHGSAIAAFNVARATFIEKCEADASDAFTWQGSHLIKLQAEAQMWTQARRFADGPRSTPEVMCELRDHAQRQMDEIVRTRSWEHNSTSAMSNLVKSDRLCGEARAWHAIREFARWALGEIRKREG